MGQGAAAEALPTTAAPATITTTTTTGAPAVAPEVAADLQETLEEFLDGWVPAGVSAAVLWPDGAFWEGGGRLRRCCGRGAPGRRDPMVIGSTTKTFTAAVRVMFCPLRRGCWVSRRGAAYFPDFGLPRSLPCGLLGPPSGPWNYTMDPGLGLSATSP